MANLLKVNVMDVKYPPAIGKVEMMSGIRTKEEAISWAVKHGYATVYFLKARERVYADKTTKAQDKSGKGTTGAEVQILFAPGERGQSVLEIAILLALGILITYGLWLLLW